MIDEKDKDLDLLNPKMEQFGKALGFQGGARYANPDIEIKERILDEAELLASKDRLVAEKFGLQTQLAEINAECAVRLPNAKFYRLQQRRQALVREMSEKEKELAGIRANLRVAQASTEITKRHAFGGSHVRQLVQLRDKWHEFSMDSENGQKSREAAWKFSQELRSILKSYFSVSDGEAAQ